MMLFLCVFVYEKLINIINRDLIMYGVFASCVGLACLFVIVVF